MDIVIISEASNESLHPVTAQMVGAASSLGGSINFDKYSDIILYILKL